MDDPDKMGDTPEDVPPVEDNETTEVEPRVVDQSSIPMRLRTALTAQFPNAMGADFNIALAQFADANRRLFTIGGDGGVGRWNHEILDVGRHFNLGQFHEVVGEAADQSLGKLCVEPFDFDRIECHLTLYHHGAFFDWHDDSPGPEGDRVNTRRVTFCYYFQPVRNAGGGMFEGGALEFMDGTHIEPTHGTLVLLNPGQRHRVTPVECWHGDWMHARFALTGWIHERQTMRHYQFTPAAIEAGACAAPEGDTTPWAQDVTCSDCQIDLRRVLAEAGHGYGTTL